ncbi:MAG: CHAT domain-containing protein [Anaerolineae bacterium]|nr:CHAT domain-containing protein [Anaerolineae bacterium]
MNENVIEGKAAWTAVLTVSPDDLAQLEQTDLPRWRRWHEEGVDALGQQVRTGNTAVEPDFLRLLERLGNRLLLDDPDAFVALAKGMADVPIQTRAGQQLLRYFGGVALGLQDRYEAALAVFDALLAEAGLDEVVYGRALNSRALYCRITGRLQEAITGYRQSLAVWQRLGNRLREGLAWLNLGIVAYQLQQYDEGEIDLNQALQCFTETGSGQWAAAAQSGLGLIYRDRGQWAAAMACFAAVVARRRADGARDSLGRVLVNISEAHLMQGHLEEAVATAQEGLAYLETKVYAMNAHLAVGLARQVAGELAAARADFEAALALAQAIGRQDMLAEAHLRLGDVLRRLGDDEAALTQFRAGANVIEATRAPLRDEGVKISLLGRWQQVYEALVLHCLEMGRATEAFAWAERARARAFVEAVGGMVEPETKMDDLPDIPPDTAVLSYFTTGVLDRELPWLQQLPSDSAVREHLLPPARTVLFFLTAAGLTAHVCPLNPNDLVWRSPRLEDRNRFLDTAVCRALYDLLLPAPVLAGAQRVLIAPHGPLHEVPFAALRDGAGRPLSWPGNPLLTMIPSVTFWRQHQRRPTIVPNRLCLAVGYDGTGHSLRHTETEARFIAITTGGDVWIGAQPKAALLAEQGGEYRWLHVACHGRFDPQSPLDSYLETGAGERLTARQVLAWRLPVELVTLSACQTGVSQVQRGDEPMGLVRAFLAAGARAVLVSQWAVADWPTFLLMRRFYQELMVGTETTAALHMAQGWLQSVTPVELQSIASELPGGAEEATNWLAGKEEGARLFAHPRFWAAFVVVG